mgnify:CR=1 FL=1
MKRKIAAWVFVSSLSVLAMYGTVFGQCQLDPCEDLSEGGDLISGRRWAQIPPHNNTEKVYYYIDTAGVPNQPDLGADVAAAASKWSDVQFR